MRKTRIKSHLDRHRELTAGMIFAAAALFTAVWGAVFGYWNKQLAAELDEKSQFLASLQQKPIQEAVGEKRFDTAAAAVTAPTETIAASALQQYVLSRVEADGGSVQSIQTEVTSDVNADGLRRLNAQLSLEASIGSLQHFLFDIEAGAPFVFVDAIAIQPASTTAPSPEDRLRVTLAMSGYWVNPGSIGREK
jgi:hypothetical protein